MLCYWPSLSLLIAIAFSYLISPGCLYPLSNLVCICIHIHRQTYIHIYTYIAIHRYLHTWHINTHEYICTYVYKTFCTQLYMYALVCVCTYVKFEYTHKLHIWKHVHTHVCLYRCMDVSMYVYDQWLIFVINICKSFRCCDLSKCSSVQV